MHRPVFEMFVLNAHALKLLKAHAYVSSSARGLSFGLSLHLCLYFLCASSTDIWFKEVKNLA